MSNANTAIVASRSTKEKKRNSTARTPRARGNAAKRTKGIDKRLMWSVCDRFETRTGTDEEGDYTKEGYISHQRALMKAGASMTTKYADFGGSTAVQESMEKSARDVADCGGKQQNTADGYDQMVKSFESWCLFALPDTHPEHVRVQAMEDALQKIKDPTVNFDVHALKFKQACPRALLTFIDVISGTEERTCESSKFLGTRYKGRGMVITSVSKIVTAQEYDMNLVGHTEVESPAIKCKLKAMWA